MRIAIINTLYAPNQIGGAEKSVQALAENFVLTGNKVIVICLGKEASSYLLNDVIVEVLKIENDYWPFELENKKAYQKFSWHLKDASNTKYNNTISELLSRFNPSILFTNNLTGFSTKVWSIAHKLNIKIVHTLRDYYLQCPSTTKFKNNLNCDKTCLNCKLLSIPKKTDANKVDYVIGISKFILKDHINNGYFKNIPNKVIYNGFDITNNRISETKDTLVFGFIGQINRSKGIELLLESFSKIKKNQTWKLLIAGTIEQEYLNFLKTINNSNQIEFLGYTKSDLFFNQIDVLIVPSLWNEPFGRVVFESIMNKKPVIASNKGGLSELLSNNKKYLFNPVEKELTKLLKKIIVDSTFLNNFLFDESFIEEFKIEKTAHQYLAVFEEVLINK
ncbi:MAG: glycosyltransferase family 4 protein [Polaribacter sp.]|nr:glycosyltransferase family 4 protein [Polaribacter sp.]